MKKIISLLSAVAMLAMAVPASAALDYEFDGDDYIVASLPTETEVAAYEPKVNITATKITDAAELAAIDTDMGSIGISTKAEKKYGKKLTTLDVYKVAVAVTDLGTLVNGYNEDYDDSYFGIYDITVGYNPANLPAEYELYPLSYTFPTKRGQASVAISSQNGNLNTVFNAGGVKSTDVYPGQNEEVVDASCVFEYLLIYPTTTETITVPYASTKVTYQASTKSPATTNVTGNDLVLGTVVPDPDPEPVEEFVVAAPKALASGFAWDVTINGYDSAKTYVATFTAGTETKVNDLTIEAQTGATINFAALLKTTKTGVELKISKN